MRATTIRFGEELWHSLELEAELAGVSVAQYISEAVVTRLAYSAARRGDPIYEVALAEATGADDQGVIRARSLREETRTLRAASEQVLRHVREGEQPSRASQQPR
jgi:hypothetical protein